MKYIYPNTGLALLCAALLLAGCAQQATDTTSSSVTESATQESAAAATTDSVNTVATIDTGSLFSDRDLAGTYDADEAISLQLNGDSASCASSAVQIDGSRITITGEGVYLITGTLTDGQIVVDAADTDKVQLVLAGADITSSTSAAIYALEADKVFVTLADGSENTLANGGEYVAIDDNNIDAVIFAKTDLTLNGSGSLTINATAGHGVVSKDDLVITGGTYTVTAASHGLCGKDVLAIAAGSFTVTSGKDGMHAENADDPSLGSLYIADGNFVINAQGDTISANGAMQIDGGTFELATGGGSESVTMSTGDSMTGFGPRGGSMETQTTTEETTTEETDTTSQKGIKAEGSMTINGGTFTADTADDCLHVGGDLLIVTGDFTLRSGDDAIHSDSNVIIQGGSISIPYCYEGIEGLTLTFDGGTFDIVSCDDGLNAAGGSDGSGFGGRGGDQFAASSDTYIIINGGTFTIVAEGDCVDSNGDLTINGGTLDLTCNGNGDTAIDTDGTYTSNGGSVTTNDGSENNPSSMGGRGGNRGGELPADGSAPSDMPQKPDGAKQEMPQDGTPPDDLPADGMQPENTESSSV